jgi:aromatic ring-opening dioxygenase catalytic subunit (LigB family)
MATPLPTFYLSHGGGPWPYMKGEIRRGFAGLEAFLKQLPGQLREEPEAILVISGHWGEKDFAVMASPSPPMEYDFSGFPGHFYHIRYPAPGAPGLAHRVRSLIWQAGLSSHLDPVRGFDHGTYSILAVTHPEADVPVIQVSVRSDYDPVTHLKLGRALASLRNDGVLIIGSGMSYHSFHTLNPKQESAQFDSWLRHTLLNSAPQQRSRLLSEWERAPAARAAHPQEDHLIPLHVAVGAAEEDPGRLVYREENFFGRITVSSYRFG